jgi:hypothetical protein
MFISNTSRIFSVVPFFAFFARMDPAQSMANPVCMKLFKNDIEDREA